MSLQKNVGFVIQRAQKEFKFMAAGLAEINCEAFVVVSSISVSPVLFNNNYNCMVAKKREVNVCYKLHFIIINLFAS